MPSKSSDARRFPRRKLAVPGVIMPGSRLCKVRNISHQGAQLVVSGSAKVPDVFELHLRSDGSVKRRCKLVWERGSEIGVNFY